MTRSRKITGEYKARGYYAVVTAPDKGDAYLLYREYMDRLGYDPVEPDNRVSEAEYKIALLIKMINAPYSKGGKKIVEKYSAEVRRGWQSKGGKIGGKLGKRKAVENSQKKSKKV